MRVLTGKQHSTVSDKSSCWCGSGDWEVFFQSRRFGLLYCPSCLCYRIDPIPVHDGKECRKFYTEYYSASGSGGERQPAGNASRLSRFFRVVKEVPELENTGERVIDFGCGDGHLCAELLEAGWKEAIGIDVSAARIDMARQNYPDILFHDSAIEQINIPHETADLIIMDNVIEHLQYPEKTLATLRKYLKPEGRLVIITPNMQSGHFRLLGRRWTPELSPHTHIYLFTPDALQTCLEKSGYEIKASGNFHLETYPVSAFLRRLLSGDVKGTVWRAMQEMGAMYGHYIKSGPMIYAVLKNNVNGRGNE